MKTENEFKIEKGIPVEHKYNKYPFRQMKVGDSFFVPLVKGKKIVLLQQNLLSAAIHFVLRKNLDWKFKSAQVDGGIRI